MKKGLIGVDSGRTNIRITVFSLEGEELMTSMFSAGSPSAFGESAFQNIEAGLDQVLEKIKDIYEIEYIQLGVSGLGSVRNVKQIEERLTKKYQIPVSMENDALIALYSLFKDHYDQGILVLSGTGSAVYGLANGKPLLVGGWGHLLEEKGSAYQLVRRAFLRIIDKYEHQIDFSAFDQTFMKILGAKDVYDLKPVFYQSSVDTLAFYSKVIDDLARCGDPDAISLLVEAGKGLASDVAICFEKLPLKMPVPLGFQGSFINQASHVKETLLEELRMKKLEVTVIEKEIKPIMGAYFRALEKVKKC